MAKMRAVQATKAGSAAPSAFGGVFVSSVPPAVGPSSGAYALYGLEPGAWTVLAVVPGQVANVRDEDTVVVRTSSAWTRLADLIGTSRETLTRELSVLADVGLIRVAPRSIVLLQPRAFPNANRRE